MAKKSSKKDLKKENTKNIKEKTNKATELSEDALDNVSGGNLGDLFLLLTLLNRRKK